MRVAEDHLVAYLVQGIRDVEGAFLLGDAGIEDHVVEQVADFLRRAFPVPLEDGVAELIHLFLRHRADGVDGLRRIPRAFFPEEVHDIEQTAEGGHLFFPGMHFIHKIFTNIQRICLYLPGLAYETLDIHIGGRSRPRRPERGSHPPLPDRQRPPCPHRRPVPQGR